MKFLPLLSVKEKKKDWVRSGLQRLVSTIHTPVQRNWDDVNCDLSQWGCVRFYYTFEVLVYRPSYNGDKTPEDWWTNHYTVMCLCAYGYIYVEK